MGTIPVSMLINVIIPLTVIIFDILRQLSGITPTHIVEWRGGALYWGLTPTMKFTLDVSYLLSIVLTSLAFTILVWLLLKPSETDA